MGGCPFGPSPKRAVTDLTGRHHHLENEYVFDGSLSDQHRRNPQLSIYGITAKLA
jgi:choline dehydrogenase-like flavoprotein